MKYKSIVISGLPGSGKNLLSQELSKQLGWKVFSIGELWREKHRAIYPKNELSFEEYWKNLGEKEQAEVNEKARKAIGEGKVIGEFRYAVCCKGLPALFIFLNADLDTRAKRAAALSKYKSKSMQQIKQILAQREADELFWGKKLFGKNYDFREKGNYNLIIDTSALNSEEMLKLILAKL